MSQDILSLQRELVEDFGLSWTSAAEILLAHDEAWTHEIRDRHGRWEREATKSATAVMARSGDLGKVGKAPGASEMYQRIKAAHMGEIEKREREKTHAKMVMRGIRHASQMAKRSEERQEKGKAKTKSMAVIASLVGGAALAYVESKTGIPDTAQIASAIAPGVIESLFEWRKRL